MSKKVKAIIDKAIKYHNINNPDKEKLTRRSLIKKMKTPLTITTIQNYKGGKTPKGFEILMEIKNITGFSIDDMLYCD